MKESTMQIQIISYLSHIAVKHDIVYFAILNETAMMILKMFRISDKTCAKIINFLKKMGLLAGIPDMCILHSGKAHFVELKNETGKVSVTQKLIHKAFNRAGFKVHIVRSLEEFKIILNDIIGE